MPDDGKSSGTGVAVLNWSDPRLQEEQASKDTGCEQGVGTGDAKGLGIVEFLRGKHILVTGATGFLAKALVEKILREQPDVGRLYLFIQPRADQPAQQRLEQLVESPIFGHLRSKHGSAYEQFMAAKLGAVEGDISREGLGLSPSVLEEIRSKVQVVINSAATTTFDERYDVALNINTQGPRRLLELAHSCPHLQLLLHVSTAFVNGRRHGRCMERPFNYGDTIAAELQQQHSTVAQGQLDIETEIALAEKERLAAEAAAEARGMSKEDVQAAVQKHMVDLGMSRAQQCGWQDTYVFTKAMAEMVLTRGHKDLPLAIVRPSIVESCLNEPMAGWMEGMRMADPILLAYGKGQMAGFLANPDGVLDMVPCDKVINAVLAIATHTASLGYGTPVSVYHVATSVANPLGIQLVADATSDHFAHSPMLERDGSAVTVQRMQVFRHPQLFMLDVWLKYQLPLQLAKLFPWNSSLSDRRNNLLLKTAQQLSYLAKLYEPYTFYAARFDASNTEHLFSLMSEEEQQHFNFDLRSIDWHAYLWFSPPSSLAPALVTRARPRHSRGGRDRMPPLVTRFHSSPALPFVTRVSLRHARFPSSRALPLVARSPPLVTRVSPRYALSSLVTRASPREGPRGRDRRGRMEGEEQRGEGSKWETKGESRFFPHSLCLPRKLTSFASPASPLPPPCFPPPSSLLPPSLLPASPLPPPCFPPPSALLPPFLLPASPLPPPCFSPPSSLLPLSLLPASPLLPPCFPPPYVLLPPSHRPASPLLSPCFPPPSALLPPTSALHNPSLIEVRVTHQVSLCFPHMPPLYLDLTIFPLPPHVPLLSLPMYLSSPSPCTSPLPPHVPLLSLPMYLSSPSPCTSPLPPHVPLLSLPMYLSSPSPCTSPLPPHVPLLSLPMYLSSPSPCTSPLPPHVPILSLPLPVSPHPLPCFPPFPSLFPPIPFPASPHPPPCFPPSPSLLPLIPLPVSPHPLPCFPHPPPCFPPSPSLLPPIPLPVSPHSLPCFPPSPSLFPPIPFPASPHFPPFLLPSHSPSPHPLPCSHLPSQSLPFPPCPALPFPIPSQPFPSFSCPPLPPHSSPSAL
ncbi:unnamed protein product [Closterium sp. Naga37s-1]|nr:unnamed protein product [Closterium sp. Naga37s-1]